MSIRKNFEKDLTDYFGKLRHHKNIGRFFSFITFGLFQNKKNIEKYFQNVQQCKDDIEKYDDLESEYKRLDNMTIEIEGVRISKHTFSDLPVSDGKDYGDDWIALRSIVLSRDNYECQELDGYCKGALQVHHIITLSKGGTNDPENLLTLCTYHHCLEHPHLMEKYDGNIWS